MATLFSAERDCDYGEDRISELPDDIRLTFLSPMGMKEAAKTSILSKQWRYLWAKRIHLDFNHLILLPESKPDPSNIYSFVVEQKNKYINWINQVVDLHCSPCIDTFRVAFRFDGSDAHHIDKWFRFALLKKVQNLELNLFSTEVVYTIGFDVLKQSVSVGDNSINFLKSLYLTSINVTGDILEYLLSRCSLLEKLYVEDSRTLVRLKVAGLSGKLKQLAIRCCENLEKLEIDATNLIYFEYFPIDAYTNLVFTSMPVVFIEASFGGNCVGFDNTIVPDISHIAAQISKLSFNLMNCEIPTGVLPSFCNLKQLNLLVDGDAEFDLVAITHFLKACPLLRGFKLEIAWHSDNDDPWREAYELQKVDLSSGNAIRDNVEFEKVFGWAYFEAMEDRELERTTHPNLKVVEVVGFNGCNADVDLILFLVVFACNLETIICDPKRCFCDRTVVEVIEASKSRAAKLRNLIPPKIRLVIN